MTRRATPPKWFWTTSVFPWGGGCTAPPGALCAKEEAFFPRQGKFCPADAKKRRFLSRTALSGINTPAGKRPEELKEEWTKAGSGAGLLLDQGKNPLEELDRLIARSANPQERENLARLRAVLKDNNIALERQNAVAAEGLIRNSLFMVETVRNYGVRHKTFVNMIAANLEERKQAKGMSPSVRNAVEQTIVELRQNRAGMERSLDAALDFYRSKVEESLMYPEALFSAKLALIGAEFKGDDVLTRNMRQAHELYSRHVGMLRQGKHARLTRGFLLRDILPANLREGLRSASSAGK